jgi:hypothetical protein
LGDSGVPAPLDSKNPWGHTPSRPVSQIDYYFINGNTGTAESLAELYNLPITTVQIYLKQLQDEERIIKKRIGKGFVYGVETSESFQQLTENDEDFNADCP